MDFDLPGRRIGAFSFNTRRAFVGVALAICIACFANYYFAWGVFGQYEKWFRASSVVALFLTMRFVGPTVQQVREYRYGQTRQ